MKLFEYKENIDISDYIVTEEEYNSYDVSNDNRTANPNSKNVNEKNKYIKKYIVQFDSPFKTDFPESNKVFGEYFTDSIEKSSRCIILLHGFKSKQKRLTPYYTFIQQALENGFSCFFMHLPFHLNRTPYNQRSGDILLEIDDNGMVNFFHQVVVDSKKSVDVLKKMFLVEDFYICGISLGGMCAVFVKAFEPRIKKAVLIQCGGNWYEIYWKSFLSKIILKGKYLRERSIGGKQSKEYYDLFPNFINILKIISDNEYKNYCDTEELKKSLSEDYFNINWFLSDPITWAHRINKNESLMICSKFDPLFNRKTSLSLKKELGDPELIWINSTHTVKIFYDKALNKKIFDFFNEN